MHCSFLYNWQNKEHQWHLAKIGKLNLLNEFFDAALRFEFVTINNFWIKKI